MFKKCIFILATSCMMYSCTPHRRKLIRLLRTQFLQTEHGVPPFDKIKLEHYEPAFLKGIEMKEAYKKKAYEREKYDQDKEL